MQLRCIQCGRQEDKVTLSVHHICTDTVSCILHLNRQQLHKVCIYCDAACDGPNTAEGQAMGIGVYTTIDGIHSPEYSGIKFLEWGTINMGEWTGLLYAMSVALLMKKSMRCTFKIFSDSQVVVNGYHKDNKTSMAVNLKPYCDKSMILQRKLGTALLGIIWIPRKHNMEADKLSKQALLLKPTKN